MSRAASAPPPARTLTTDQLVTRTGVSRVTIYQWKRRGLLGPPYIYTDPKGKGRRAYWQPETVDLVRDLREFSGRGVPLKSVIRRHENAVMDGSSISCGTAQEMAERWWAPGSASDLATFAGMPAPRATRGVVLAVAVEQLAKEVGLHEEAANTMGHRANSDLRTVLHNFIKGVESVVVWNGAMALVAPKFALDSFHGGHTNVLRTAIGLPEIVLGLPGMENHWSTRPALVSVEINALVSELWKHYGEAYAYAESGLPSSTLSRGSSVRDYAGTDGQFPQHVEYDYRITASGFEDEGLTIEIDTATARLADQGPSARFWRTEREREATQREIPASEAKRQTPADLADRLHRGKRYAAQHRHGGGPADGKKREAARPSRARAGTGRAVKRKAPRK